MFGKTDEKGVEIPWTNDLVRLAIPRRVYTQSHMDFVVEGLERTFERRDEIAGLELVYQQPVLRHFTARFKRLPSVQPA